MEQKFKKLKIWQKSMDFAESIYKLTSKFPKEEQYGLSSQMRRASVSISLNIAEGSGCETDKEFNRFLSIALRSSYEVMCGLELAKRMKYCDEIFLLEIYNRLDEIAAMIAGFKKKLMSES